ncbi:hypothetical protein Y032_0527g2960 [Ancylostoma ceylanicum]|uniref:Uncharacterized protein n=1 Tax=Ancylostoma ceylanicum TaxID=53326 RepID=A0A016WU71_9BILA|nr:hypothetical protein Y032_0527g2960 [Ancylostoma ceylanicum]
MRGREESEYTTRKVPLLCAVIDLLPTLLTLARLERTLQGCATTTAAHPEQAGSRISQPARRRFSDSRNLSRRPSRASNGLPAKG